MLAAGRSVSLDGAWRTGLHASAARGEDRSLVESNDWSWHAAMGMEGVFQHSNLNGNAAVQRAGDTFASERLSSTNLPLVPTKLPLYQETLATSC